MCSSIDPYDPYKQFLPDKSLVDWIGISYFHFGHEVRGRNLIPGNNIVPLPHSFFPPIEEFYRFAQRLNDDSKNPQLPILIAETSAVWNVDGPVNRNYMEEANGGGGRLLQQQDGAGWHCPHQGATEVGEYKKDAREGREADALSVCAGVCACVCAYVCSVGHQDSVAV